MKKNVTNSKDMKSSDEDFQSEIDEDMKLMFPKFKELFRYEKQTSKF